MPEDSENRSAKEFIRLDQLDEWNDRKYHIEKYGNEFSLILIGEIHNVEISQKKQVEVVRIVRPEYVLCEILKGWIYDPATKEFQKKEGRDFDAIYDEKPEKLTKPIGRHHLYSLHPDLIAAADEIGFKIIGCDITIKEMADLNKSRDEQMLVRDQHMKEVILEYQEKSLKPIVAIMGVDHANHLHDQKALQEKEFGYVYINQTRKD